MLARGGCRGGEVFSERPAANKSRIREVWKGNLHKELYMLRQLIDKYPYMLIVRIKGRGVSAVTIGVSLTFCKDSVFPGVMARPLGSFNRKNDFHYQCVRCNVDCSSLAGCDYAIH